VTKVEKIVWWNTTVSSDSDKFVAELEVTSDKFGETAHVEPSLVNSDRFDDVNDNISDSDSKGVSEKGSVTGSVAVNSVHAGAPVNNYVAPSVSVPVHVIISDNIPKRNSQ
jgi:hypothetical protein